MASNGLPFGGEYGWRRIRTPMQWRMKHMARVRWYWEMSARLKREEYQRWAVYR